MKNFCCVSFFVAACAISAWAGVADFDGDGRTDLSVFRPSDGTWYLNRSSLGFAAVNWGISGDRPAPGDFDADGKTDFAIFRPAADGSLPDFYVLRSSDLTVMYAWWGLPSDTPVVGDYDGDLRSDFTLKAPAAPPADPQRGRAPQRALRGTFGDAGAVLTVSSFSGNIVIVKP